MVLEKLLTALEKMQKKNKIIFIVVAALIAIWLMRKKMQTTVEAPMLPPTVEAPMLPPMMGGAGMLPALPPMMPAPQALVEPAPGYDGEPLKPYKTTAYVPGAGFQDPGYGSGQGSIGAVKEGFLSECLGMAPTGTEYPSMPFVQVACRPEPDWNLPMEARMRHRPMYPNPVGVPNCQRRHPMDSIYAPPNEGFDLAYNN